MATIRFVSAMVLVLAGVHMPAAWAQMYPSKAVKINVPFVPGGPVDTMARLLAQRLTEQLGVQVFVENRPGANGALGTEAGAKAPPDGYTLTYAAVTSFAILPNLKKSLAYDPRRSFAPISQVSSGPFFVVVNAAVPVRTLVELIDLARKRPGALNFATAGSATPHHLAFELFKIRAGVDVVAIPYGGSAKVIPDLIEGRVDVTFDNALVLLPHIKSGKLRALAVASSSRTEALPQVPTALEAGLPDFEVAVWNGVLAPANTPKEIVSRLHREIVAASSSTIMREGITKFAMASATSGSPEEFRSFIDREIRRWGEMVKVARMPLED